ncbi:MULTISPECIES: histidinol-phosphatase [Novosphingobium]|uniref:Histidinol-phosphatase n=1 Tax=Novosphingobium decolorationis TaxID=2698673 RepID=A0ABX8E6W0_9SPHN|nr:MULTISPECIES: histidinol-phosphatase [Novosphingobium]MED5543703.1 histidinol-phosphatase [Pseudomonadota bacterium]QVM84912.1 histidinol-phosphatase [Novosphingobium decolorationis]GAM03967.1 inositol monophosphatase [Novosphingobium sp. MBES04]
MTIEQDLALALRLADAAGEAIRPYFRAANLDTEKKGDASPVTVADRAAEEAMREILRAEAPEDGITGEEFGTEKGTSRREWVLDPIDGTVSFVVGRPIFGTLIALLVDGWPVLGVIDQPILGERWVGASGRATTFNGKPIETRRCRELSDAVLATTGPHYFDNHQGEHFMALAAKTDHKRMVMGGDCYNYGLLASGHIDLVCEAGLKLYDWAALVPIVEGAGGMMCDWNGDPLHAASEGHVLALGDPARMEDVVEAMVCNH